MQSKQCIELSCHSDVKQQPPKVFCKKSASGLQLYSKETLAQVFSCEFSQISKNTFFTEHLWTTAFGR